jgi:Beta-propeller repeat
VRYSAVYPGIDLVYYGNRSQLEYDFVLAPGADPGAIRLRFHGADRLRLNPDGDVVVAAHGSEILQKRPFIYQQDPASGARRAIGGLYVLLGRNTVGLRLEAYDRTRELVIDPVLSYLTYMGGSVNDRINALKYANGKIYIAGQTDNADQSYIDGAYNNNFTGLTDIFIAIVDATPGKGYPLLYFSYLGGTNIDIPRAIDVDAKGVVYLTGTTTSTDFPVTGSAFQSSGAGQFTGTFVVKLDPSLYGGDSLVFSSYLGGIAGVNIGNGIAVDSQGMIYVIGSTQSSDFPVTGNAMGPVMWGPQDAFVCEIDPGAGHILYASYVGGEDVDDGRNILVGANGLVYFTASTLSSQFPMANFQYSINPLGAEDVVIGVMDLTKSGNASLLYSTYFGGSGNDEVRAMAFDAKGRLVITGYTLSTDIPVTGDAAQSTGGGNGDAFVVLFDPSILGRGGLVYSTYFGGAHTEVGYAAGADSAGSIYIAGYTLSANMPVAGDVPQSSWGGGTDLFIAKFKPGTPGPAGLQFSTFLGSSNVYVPTGMSLAPDGRIFVAGYGGIGLPSSSNARQGGYAGGATDGFFFALGQ